MYPPVTKPANTTNTKWENIHINKNKYRTKTYSCIFLKKLSEKVFNFFWSKAHVANIFKDQNETNKSNFICKNFLKNFIKAFVFY